MDLQTWLATTIGTAGLLSPIVAAIVWLAKQTPISSRYYPHVSVVSGIVVAYAIAWMRPDLILTREASLIGFIAGAIAAGAFMVGKSGESPTTTVTTTTTEPPSSPKTEVAVTSTVASTDKP